MSLKKKIVLLSVLFISIGIAIVLTVIITQHLTNCNTNDIANGIDYQIMNESDGNRDDDLRNGKIDEEGYLVDKSGSRISKQPIMYKCDADRLKKDSLLYNEKLQTTQSDYLVSKSSYEGAALDMRNYGVYNGIYGYIEADSISMKLPIYLGANEYNMMYGATHLNYTSLPTLESNNTNVVLSAHTGYIGKTLFDNLPALNIGDTVSITTYFDTIRYKVTDMSESNPSMSTSMYIQKGKNLLTLVTCASGGRLRYVVVCEKV